MPALKFVRAVVLAFASSLALSTPAQVVVSPITAQVFTPGAISAMAVQPDGKVILAGTGEGMPNGIGRFNTDGSTDFSWSPPVFYGGSADRVWIDPAGAVYVGGSFSAVGGVARNRLARLSGTTGALDTTWNPGPNAAVATMAFFNGAIYVGGQFSNIGGQTRAGLAKLSATGSGAADPTWNPGSGGNYLSIVADASGNLYVGGTFTISGALPFTFFNNLVRLGSAGAGAVDQNWNPSPDATVLSLALDGAGGLFVGGTFATIGGQSRSRLAKIPTGGNGAADPTWNPAPNNSPSALALDGSSLYVVGLFTNIGGANRSFIARLAATGTGAADSWNPGANSSVNLVAVSPSSAFVGGAFASAGVNGGGRFGFVALDKVSGSASSLYPRMLAGGVVNAIVRDASGRTVVGGRFQYVGDGTFNTTRPNIARFNPDGTLDNTWSPQVNGTVRALALSLSGLLYVGGDSLTVGGNYRGGVERIPMSGSGGVDSWSPFADGSVHALALDDSGNIYAGGYFGSIGFETASNLARVSTSTGFADAAWKPNPDGVVSALALDGQGNLFAAGSFNAIGALTRQSVAKLSTVGAGSADAAWNANISGPVHALEIDHSGNVFVGGSFTVPAIIGTRRSLVRLSVAGGVLDLGQPLRGRLVLVDRWRFAARDRACLRHRYGDRGFDLDRQCRRSRQRFRDGARWDGQHLRGGRLLVHRQPVTHELCVHIAHGAACGAVDHERELGDVCAAHCGGVCGDDDGLSRTHGVGVGDAADGAELERGNRGDLGHAGRGDGGRVSAHHHGGQWRGAQRHAELHPHGGADGAGEARDHEHHPRQRPGDGGLQCPQRRRPADREQPGDVHLGGQHADRFGPRLADRGDGVEQRVDVHLQGDLHQRPGHEHAVGSGECHAEHVLQPRDVRFRRAVDGDHLGGARGDAHQ
jgi:hypothetical protein